MLKKKSYIYILTLILLFACNPQTSGLLDTHNYTLSKEELKKIGQQIFLNETGGNIEYLIFWNKLEAFPSLGVGHFIWLTKHHPAFKKGAFPLLVHFYLHNGFQKKDLPKLMQNHPHYCPWNTREEMYKLYKNKDPDILSLRSFLLETFDVQILFILRKFRESVVEMMAVTDYPEHLQKQLHRMMKTRGGYYPLIDYANFKGIGLHGSDTPDGANGTPSYPLKQAYGSYGWGLRQVLIEMKGEETGQAALKEFARSAIFVLKKRIENAAKEGKDESHFLRGWLIRISTYKTPVY